MADDKPVHVPRTSYPEAMYPQTIAPPPTVYEEEKSTHLLDYWYVILSRRWTVLAVLVTVVTITMIATFKQVPVYQATTTIQIDRENPNILTFKDVYEVESATDDTLQTQFRILSSRTMARRVLEDLKLDQNEEFKDDGQGNLIGSYVEAFRKLFRTPPPGEAAEPDHLRPLIDSYISRLNVNQVPRSRLVAVSFDAKNPQLGASIVNAHARHYIEQNLEFKWQATQEASEFLSEQLKNLKAGLEKAYDDLEQYSREHQILFTENGQNTATEKLQQLEREYTNAQADRFQKESFNKLLAEGKAETLPQIVTNPIIATLKTRLADLSRQDSELGVTFSREYPRRLRLQSQIEETSKQVEAEKDRVEKMVRSEYDASVEREKLLDNALADQSKLVEQINQEIIQYNILKREADSKKLLYEGLLTRLNEAGVSAGLRASNIRIVDKAEVPPLPIRPRKTLNLMLALASGLLLGIGLAYFQEYLDSSVKSAEEITTNLNLTLLGTIPKMASLGGRSRYARYAYKAETEAIAEAESGTERIELISHNSPSSLMSESYRSVRTSLLLSSPDRPPRSFVVTSALPSEGKTVTAINTAISLTQTGSRVVLVDADMRKPRVHSVFGLEGKLGLSAFLAGNAKLKDVIETTSIDNLFIIPCGVIPPNPSELLMSSRFKQMISVLSEFFDHILVDSPPVTNVSDARVVASTTEGVIVVVKALSTSRHLLKRTIETLSDSRTKVLGVILNDVDMRVRSSYYSPYYRGGYSGYSGYYGKY